MQNPTDFLQMLKQMWPYVGDYVKTLLKTQWEASLGETMAGYKLYNFKFEKIYLGDIVSSLALNVVSHFYPGF